MASSSTPKPVEDKNRKYMLVHASSHATHLSLSLQEAFATRNFVDITITCGAATFYAHR